MASHATVAARTAPHSDRRSQVIEMIEMIEMIELSPALTSDSP
jgi:hypothetical protein